MGICSSFVAAGLIVVPLTPAYSLECTDVLVVSTYGRNYQSSSDWRLSQYLSEDQYNELRKSAKGSARIYGISMGASYDEYRQNSQKKIQQSNESLTKAQAENVIWTGLDEQSVRAYEACLRSKEYGLFLYPRSATRQQVELRLEYRPLGSTVEIDLNWPGAPKEMDLPKSIAANESRTIVVPRPTGADSEILISVNGAGGTASAITITAYPNPPLPPQPSWQVVKVSMRDPVLNTGQPGTAALPDGYQVRNIRYHNIPPDPNNHEFLFDIFSSAGRVQSDISYIAKNGAASTERVSSVQIDNHVLKYQFANWNDGASEFHYSWE